MMVPWLLNTAWMFKCTAEAAAFARASRRVAHTQLQLLVHTLSANRDTEFGRSHRFHDITDASSYQKRVPLATYHDFSAAIRGIVAGETNVLTREPVRLLEPTSGTSGGEKLIPYTVGLRRQFQRGVATWIHDLFSRRPLVRKGRAYWSISPMLGPSRRTSAGLPIGFDDDTAYLGSIEQFGLRHLLVTPAHMARLPDMDSFRYITLLFLLAADDLALISVWSPTFLTSLLAPLEEWQERLCYDLRRGSLSLHSPIAQEIDRSFRRWQRPNPGRADYIGDILRSSAPWPAKLRRIWPGLAIISCWADGSAAQFVLDLHNLFPDVEIQPKGLLATEGFVSFPLIDRAGAALALRCHFFEFEELGTQARCRLAHELDGGGRYRLVLTTAGGLYRYQLHDEVEIVGFHNQCPLLKFIGKSDAISDLVGEKLAESHVRGVLNRALAAQSLQARFALVVPIMDRPARYRLYIQAPQVSGPSPLIDSLRKQLQDGLMENPYYRHAVAARQLAPLEATVLDPAAASAWLVYEQRCLADGQKCGSIKPMTLDRRLGWPETFACLESKCRSDHK
jgi:hypothetical protein